MSDEPLRYDHAVAETFDQSLAQHEGSISGVRLWNAIHAFSNRTRSPPAGRPAPPWSGTRGLNTLRETLYISLNIDRKTQTIYRIW
jgi:hypothetical protein